MTLIMLAVVAIYTHRDLFPLATYTSKPMDGAQGWLLWSRLCLAFLVGVLIPLALPRTYTPVDPLVYACLSLIHVGLISILARIPQRKSILSRRRRGGRS